jgi:hypothetical protein
MKKNRGRQVSQENIDVTFYARVEEIILMIELIKDSNYLAIENFRPSEYARC